MTPIPENAPFTPEQAAWLNRFLSTINPAQMQWFNGFIAGCQFAGVQAPGAAQPVAPAQPPAKVPVTVLYGTESGNSEALADDARKELAKRGFKVTLTDMGDIEPAALKDVKNLLVIISTWGEGDPPERAVEFYEKFMNDGAPKLNETNFAVCGLGDTSYAEFCKMGKDFDARLEALGASRMVPRADCDVDYEEGFKLWFDTFLKELDEATAAQAVDVAAAAPGLGGFAAAPGGAQWSKANPFQAELVERINLNGTGSAKETYHLEFSLEGSGLTYLPGDSLGVKPRNCPEVVDQLIEASGFSGNEDVNRADGSAGALRHILVEELDSTTLSRKVVEEYSRLTGIEDLSRIMESEEKVRHYCEGRQVVDLFTDYPPKDLSPQQLTNLLRLQPPRLYSISSSLKKHPDQVHLTVGAVRYQSHGRDRKGVASTYLADRVDTGDTVPVYIHANTRFRLPEDSDRPILMIGPGTGIAPFRSFIEERSETGASGKNWLLFGDQHFSYDFLYQLEWQDYLKDGILNRMDVAFSRDAPEKVYVQQRLHENSKEVYRWIEEGAHVYVCGDAQRMAKDVNQALLDIIAKEGAMSEEAAREYLSRLSKEKRYQRDCY